MSLLDGGNELVKVFVEVKSVDSDGNPVMVPSPFGIEVLARVQPFSNVASAEDATIGQELNTRFRVRLDRRAVVPYGPWSMVEWRGQRYEVLGEPEPHNGSDRTRHTTAIIRRK